MNRAPAVDRLDLSRAPIVVGAKPAQASRNSLLGLLVRKGGLAAWSATCRTFERFEESQFSGNSEFQPPKSFARSLRVALVKQSTYCDLYSNPSAATARELLESSWHRTGPIGLFLRFDARFIIVRPEPDVECRVAEEKRVYGLSDPGRARTDAERVGKQSAVAVAADSVDWSEFDLVIAIENAVPTRIALMHPKVLWATLLEHHRMLPYAAYLRRPPAGYDAFLNLRYGPNPRSLGRRAHVIDWPYNFNLPRGISDLYPEVARENRVFLEDHQTGGIRTALSGMNQDGADAPAAQDLPQFLKSMLRSKVFCAVRPSRPLGGLALIDAVASGCVVLADRSFVWNPFLITRETDVRSVDRAVELTRLLFRDASLFSRIQSEQARRLAWFCHERPLGQFAQLVRSSPRTLSAAKHLSPA